MCKDFFQTGNCRFRAMENPPLSGCDQEKPKSSLAARFFKIQHQNQLKRHRKNTPIRGLEPSRDKLREQARIKPTNKTEVREAKKRTTGFRIYETSDTSTY